MDLSNSTISMCREVREYVRFSLRDGKIIVTIQESRDSVSGTMNCGYEY
jgi:hypothetical protein